MTTETRAETNAADSFSLLSCICISIAPRLSLTLTVFNHIEGADVVVADCLRLLYFVAPLFAYASSMTRILIQQPLHEGDSYIMPNMLR